MAPECVVDLLVRSRAVAVMRITSIPQTPSKFRT
jgi:hypothetical protein